MAVVSLGSFMGTPDEVKPLVDVDGRRGGG